MNIDWARVMGVTGLVLGCWCLVSVVMAIWWSWWVRAGRQPPRT